MNTMVLFKNATFERLALRILSGVLLTRSSFGMQAAMELFEEQMPELGVQPDIITYNSLLRALGRSKDSSNSASVLHLYDRLCDSSGLTPDKYTFSALFSSAGRLGISDGSFLLRVRFNHSAALNQLRALAGSPTCLARDIHRDDMLSLFA